MSRARWLIALLPALLLAACIKTGDVEPRVKASPTEAARINTQLGIEYMRKGENQKALEKLERAVKQDEDFAPAHSALALVLEQLGVTDEADQHYRRAVKLAANDAGVRNMYGTYLCRNGRVKEGEKHFLAAASNPRYATPEVAYTNAGTCLLSAQQEEKAEQYFRKALTYNGNYSDALWKLAELSHELDRDIQARAFMQRLEDAVGRLPPGALWLGHRIERRLGDTRAANRYAQQLKEGFPESVETGLLLESEEHGG